MGKLTPKLSESVNTSLPIPDHCLVILPTSDPSPADVMLKSMSEQHSHPHSGPSIVRISSPRSFFTANSGVQNVHFCSTYPMMVPGGLWTSSSCKQYESYVKEAKVV